MSKGFKNDNEQLTAGAVVFIKARDGGHNSDNWVDSLLRPIVEKLAEDEQEELMLKAGAEPLK